MTTAALPHTFRHQLMHQLRQVSTSRPAWVFATAWMVSVAVLVVSGYGLPVFSILYGLGLLVFSLLTVAITQPNPASQRRAAEGRSRVALQVGVLLVFILLTAWNGLAFHQVVPSSPGLPFWTPLVDALSRLGGQWFGNDNYVVNPVAYTVLPLVVLLLMGVAWRSLGFERGHRMGRVLLLWCAFPLVAFVSAIVSAQVSLGFVLARLVSNFMQNGFFEEFLFRGALQTRLRLLWGPGWALVLQALLFGVWHVGLGYTTTAHAGLLPALAISIINQGVMGLAFGIMFERTRNLLVPSIVHIVVNSLG